MVALHCEQERLMFKIFSRLSLAALLTTGVAAGAMAAGGNGGSTGSQHGAESQTGTGPVAPGAGNAVNTPSAPSPTYSYPRSGSRTPTGMSAQSTGQSNPGGAGTHGNRRGGENDSNHSGGTGAGR
jgi:hypothetical protein